MRWPDAIRTYQYPAQQVRHLTVLPRYTVAPVWWRTGTLPVHPSEYNVLCHPSAVFDPFLPPKTTFPAKEIAKPEIFPSLLFYYGMLTITATRGSRLVLSIPNYNVRKQYYEFMLEEYQDKRHINLNNLMDLFDEMAYEGHWRETLEFIAHAYKENSSVRSAMEGERNIQGFFTAYLSVNAYYLMAPEMELSHGYCDLFLMPDLMRYEVKHSYILELKYLSVKDTEEKARTQWQEAVKQINEYAAAPRVRQLVQNTKLHCIIIQFRGWELERMEEV